MKGWIFDTIATIGVTMVVSAQFSAIVIFFYQWMQEGMAFELSVISAFVLWSELMMVGVVASIIGFTFSDDD